MGRKAYWVSQRDSRVAEISSRYSAPGFFCAIILDQGKGAGRTIIVRKEQSIQKLR